MVRNLLKTAWRSLIKNRVYSFANVFGLAIGMAAALVLAKFVGFSLTYNDFLPDADKIYAVSQTEFKEGYAPSSQRDTYWAVGQQALELYPEILAVARASGTVEMLVTNHQNASTLSFNENKILTVDSSFLRIFSFPAVSGDRKTALTSPNSIVLTQSTAKKYFGDTDPIGQTLTTRVSWGQHTDYRVTCVLEDIPANSTLQFNFLIPSGLAADPENYWHDASFDTYFLLDDSADPAKLGREMSRAIGESPILTSANKRLAFSLRPLSDNTLSSSEWMLLMIGGFILIISWINFANLSIGKVLSRYKETGVRKVIGATRLQVFSQFIAEALLINGMALAIAFIVILVSTPYLTEFTNAHFLPLVDDPTPLNPIFIAAFVVGAGISSAYPSFLLAQLNPVSALKGKYSQGRNSVRLRKTLVIIQFSISVICTIGIFVISDQMEYMQNHDLKINVDRTLIIESPKDSGEGKGERLMAFKEEASNLAMIEDVTSSATTPGKSYRHEVYFTYKDTTSRSLFYINTVAANFLEFYGVKFLAGESFRPHAREQNLRSVVLNQSAARALGFADLNEAIGEKIIDHEENRTLEIIGIVEDYHQLSLKNAIQPQAFCYNRNSGDISLKISRMNYLSIADLQRCISDLHVLWKKLYPDQPFDYYFLDARVDSQYHEDVKFRKIFGLFAGISVFIACFGLFGLSLFISLKRTKEIGIRKVFGASSSSILLLFTKDYVIQIAIAVLIGGPSGYFLMKNWLNDYTFKTSINGWSLAIPSLFLLFVSLGTIAFHTIKASVRNPVANLREE